MKNRVSLLLSAIAGSVPLAGTASTPTNIIIINLDDVGYGDFSFNGALGYETPHIDQMAAQGMRFTHFLAAQPVSGASRTALLTGCYPNRIGMYGAPCPGEKRGVHPDEMNMAELVKQKGYQTAIFGKWHLGDDKPFLPIQNGFDEYYGLPYSNDMWPNHPSQGTVFNFPDLPTMDGNEVVGYNTDQSRFTTDYTEKAVAFIEKNKRKPFLLYLAHSMPHVPLAVSDKFKGKSEQGLYGDVMMEIDWSVGQVLKTVRDLKLEKNTLIILTSDNGPWMNYGNHAGSTAGLREAKGVSFEGGNRVPCIMYWKGKIAPGTTCSKLLTNMDIFPTVAEISQAPLPDRKIDGVNILPVIMGDKQANPRESFAYYYNKNDLQAVTDGRFKLVFPHRYVTYTAYLPGKDGLPGKMGTRTIEKMELYDLRRDPGERYDVSAQYPEVVDRLAKLGDEFRDDLGDNLQQKQGRNTRPMGKVD